MPGFIDRMEEARARAVQLAAQQEEQRKLREQQQIAETERAKSEWEAGAPERARRAEEEKLALQRAASYFADSPLPALLIRLRDVSEPRIRLEILGGSFPREDLEQTVNRFFPNFDFNKDSGDLITRKFYHLAESSFAVGAEWEDMHLGLMGAFQHYMSNERNGGPASWWRSFHLESFGDGIIIGHAGGIMPIVIRTSHDELRRNPERAQDILKTLYRHPSSELVTSYHAPPTEHDGTGD